MAEEKVKSKTPMNEMMRIIARKPNGVFPSLRKKGYGELGEPTRFEQDASENAPTAAALARRKKGGQDG